MRNLEKLESAAVEFLTVYVKLCSSMVEEMKAGKQIDVHALEMLATLNDSARVVNSHILAKNRVVSMRAR